jgi:predicted AAA+ superfamily ATPase
MNMTSQDELRIFQRIAQAIERLGPTPEPKIDIKSSEAYTWNADAKDLIPVPDTHAIDLKLLVGLEEVRDTLLANTMQFAKGYSANNVLLWGARGMGKSSLVKAVHAHVNQKLPKSVVLIEIHREDIKTMPLLLNILRGWVIRRFILFCDDLSFDESDHTYKSLKAVLEGGIEGRPDHVLFYATSNRRHLMPRDMIENESGTAINPSEAIEEKISLSDRFGLWLGFHSCTQDDYLAMVDNYVKHYKLSLETAELHTQALQWAASRGNRSGRVAWQFIQDLAGKMGKRIS